MKKVRGKALALVLSIALVVSSFSTAFSSAATRSESGATVSADEGGLQDEYFLANGGVKTGAVDTLSVAGIGLGATLTTAKHQTTDGTLVALSHASGTSLVKWTFPENEGDGLKLTLRSKDIAGTETLNALYKGTIEDGDDTIKVSGTKQVTITVFGNKSVVISDLASAPEDAGVDARFSKTFAQKTTEHELAEEKVVTLEDSALFTLYQAAPSEDSAEVTWTPVTAGENTYTLSASSNIDYTTTPGTVYVKQGSSAGNVTLTATRTSTADKDTYPDSKVTAKTKITKTILVSDDNASKTLTNFVRSGSTTYLADDDTIVDGTVKIPVNSYEVKFADNAADILVQKRASVDTISGKVKSLGVLDGGYVNAIGLDAGAVTVSGEKAKAGAVSADTVTLLDGATVGAVTADSGEIDDPIVSITNATAGDITSSGKVEILADQEDAVTKTGGITAKGNVTLNASDENAKISVGTLKSNSDGLTYDITGNVSIGGVDFNYYDATLAFSDFQGKVPAPEKVLDGTGAITTTNADDSVEVTGAATLDTVTAEDETTITFDDKATINDLEGPGAIVIKAGNLTVLDGLYNATLKLSDEPITVGLKVFKASAGAVNVDDFTPYGYTLKAAEGNDYDTFSVDALQFVGLKINGNGRIVKDDKTTFTASAYPTGSPIPEGYTVDWSVDNTDKFTATKNADGSVTVEAANFDEDFASENKGVLTATLIDEDGYEYDEDYEPGTLDLTEIKVPDTTYKSDTTGTVKLDLGGTYQFKITSLDSKPVTLAVASKGASVTLAGVSGNDYFYKVTGAKVGNYGVYVNADKTPVAVLNITSNVKIDTTTVTIASGKTYQFKVTAPAQPTFQVAGLGTIALAQKIGNDYFYKVTANNVKGGHGVYVNGVRLAIATFA